MGLLVGGPEVDAGLHTSVDHLSRACEKSRDVLVVAEIAPFVLNRMRFVPKNACNVRMTEPLKHP